MDKRLVAVNAAREAIRSLAPVLFELHGMDAEYLSETDWWRQYVTICHSLAEAGLEAAESAKSLYHRVDEPDAELLRRRDALVQALGDSVIARDEALG